MSLLNLRDYRVHKSPLAFLSLAAILNRSPVSYNILQLVLVIIEVRARGYYLLKNAQKLSRQMFESKTQALSTLKK